MSAERVATVKRGRENEALPPPKGINSRRGIFFFCKQEVSNWLGVTAESEACACVRVSIYSGAQRAPNECHVTAPQRAGTSYSHHHYHLPVFKEASLMRCDAMRSSTSSSSLDSALDSHFLLLLLLLLLRCKRDALQQRARKHCRRLFPPG